MNQAIIAGIKNVIETGIKEGKNIRMGREKLLLLVTYLVSSNT